MQRCFHHFLFLVVGMLVFLTACSSSPSKIETAATATAESSPETYITPKSIDEKFLNIEKSVPGFAGFYYVGKDIIVNIAGTKLATTDKNTVISAIADEFGEEVFNMNFEPKVSGLVTQGEVEPTGEDTASRVELEATTYTFSQLNTFHNKVGEFMSEAGVVFTDASENANVVTVGLSDMHLVGKFEQRLKDLEIPSGAVVFEKTAPAVMEQTVRDVVSPTVGGIQISFPGYVCTLGYNVQVGFTRYFITNSHCSLTQGGIEGTRPLAKVGSVVSK